MESTPLLQQPKIESWWSRLRLWRIQRENLCSRKIIIGELPEGIFPPNSVCNQKYTLITFLPLVLFNEFRFFLNFYFLLMALSQFIPSIRIGYMYTYWGPLCFVLAVTLIREALDDYGRYRRDRKVNGRRYDRLVLAPAVGGDRRNFFEVVAASSLRVGDIVILHKGERVPADMLLLRTNETSGTVFIQTDQLDGEIDWKLRIPIPITQRLPSDAHLLDVDVVVDVDRPEKDIHSFIGECKEIGGEEDQLDIENTLWSGCVVASGQAVGLVVYTGAETRAVMNNTAPRSKVGKLDLQVNNLTKILGGASFFTAVLLIILKGFDGPWFAFFFRFVLLFSYIIPISLRVNLEMGKAFYAYMMKRDKKIEGTIMRSTTIPEELGRVQYLLADKTGTLTKNEMFFQKLHLGNVLYDKNTFHEVESLVTQYVTKNGPSLPTSPVQANPPPFSQQPSTSREGAASPRQVWQAVLALALCHNVTPSYGAADSAQRGDDDAITSSVLLPQQELCDYQASSPDEVALVKWTDMMGIALYKRNLHKISLKLRATNTIVQYTILQIFPFTSETKMMGIIVKEEQTSEISYFVKGADVALSPLVPSSWLARESGKLAAGGLRTMGVAMRTLSIEQYEEFEIEYKEARRNTVNRNEKVAAVIGKLNCGLTLLGLTGVEDRLADDVKNTLSILKAAGIKIWMLTGDKLETALCIARSLELGGGDDWLEAAKCSSRRDAHNLLMSLSARERRTDLVIEGETLETCLESYAEDTVSLLMRCSGVVVARCSPTQKAVVARQLRGRGAHVAAAGDGGNDVAMLHHADVGIGIEGAEGRAAALASDVSVRRVAALAPLLLVHGRRAATRSSALCLFIVHRGLVISTMQAVFSVVFYFSSVSLYPGFLMIGYGTIYTVLPVFSLVLDKDISRRTALQNPRLYQEVTGGKQLSYKTFYIWTAISIYQGAVMMYGALILFEEQLIHIVEISYTALILTELIMVALTIVTWHRLMIVAEFVSLLMYTATLLIFTTYFDSEFITHWDFWWKVAVITFVAWFPIYITRFAQRKCRQRRNKLRPSND